MTIDFSTKPKITLHLDPVHEAYCRYIFSTPGQQREIVISRYHDIGKLIHSNVLAKDLPVRRPFLEHPVTFILPVNPDNQHAITRHFLYCTKWGEQKIRDGIEYEFKSWVRRRFEIGYKNKLDQKEIVEAILRGLSLRENAINFDTIKKIDYRNRRRIEEMRFKSLLSD